MARGSRSNTSAPSRDLLGSLLAPVSMATPLAIPSGHLLDIEDGRLWHPDADHGALTIGGRFAHVVVHKRPVIGRANTIWSGRGLPVGVQVPVGIQFESPLKVVTCVRRKVRRQIMFATGRGGKFHRKPRRSWRSDIKC